VAIVRTSLSRQVADELCRRIVDGEYCTGDRLPSIQALAEEFKVSVPSVRESLRTLEIAALVRVEHGRGVFVTDALAADARLVSAEHPDSATVAHKHRTTRAVYEARMVLEVACVPLALERLTVRSLRKLQRLVGQMADMEVDLVTLARADVEFHGTLAAAAGNPMLTEMMGLLLDALRADMKFPRTLSERRTAFYEDHAAILARVEARDVVGTEQLLREHLRGALDVMTGYREFSSGEA
jgi:GntR family transcriptional repressor for pyruvate dehydrogenase complex